jgi:hypothetical protein
MTSRATTVSPVQFSRFTPDVPYLTGGSGVWCRDAAAIRSAINDNRAPTDRGDERQCAINSHSCPIVIVRRWLSDHPGVHPVAPQMGEGRLVDVLMPPPISADQAPAPATAAPSGRRPRTAGRRLFPFIAHIAATVSPEVGLSGLQWRRNRPCAVL